MLNGQEMEVSGRTTGCSYVLEGMLEKERLLEEM